MEYSYKFRIYPTTEQQAQIQKTFGCTRFVYNHYLSKRKEAYSTSQTTLNAYACMNDMTALKRELVWLKEVDATALQASVQTLDIAYQNFFRRVKQGVKGDEVGFPKFKSKHNHRKSYKSKCVGANIKVLDKCIQLPKLGYVECRISKEVRGRILSATVSQNPSGKYFVSFCCTDVEIEPLPSTGVVVGIDLGIKEYAITSDGQHIDNPKFYSNSQKKLAKLQRQLSRKTKGSKNREKARIKKARFEEHIANQRRDTLQKLSTQFIREYDVICLEDLAVKNMVKCHSRAKHISDAGWSEFVSELQYKADWYGKVVVQIDRFYPSSQTCSVCGAKWSGTKDTKVRDWVCPICGVHHDRDVNAAINILNEGMRLLAV